MYFPNLPRATGSGVSADLAEAQAPKEFRAFGQIIALEPLLDRVGTGVSAVCTAKCVGLPLAAAVLPSLSVLSQSPIVQSPAAHWAILATAAPLAVRLLILAELKAGRATIASVSAAGLILMTAGVFGHSHTHAHGSADIHTRQNEKTVSVSGVGSVSDPICGVSALISSNSVEHKNHIASSISHDPEHKPMAAGWAHWAYAAGGAVLGAGHLLRLLRIQKKCESNPVAL